MTVNTKPSSRRALLAAAAGGTVALVAESLARPLPALAHDPEDVLLGGRNDSESTTELNNWTGSETVLKVESVHGSAIDATSDESPGIRAVSNTEVAISAVSKQHIGIVGWGGEPASGGGSTHGVMGRSGTGCGVIGMSSRDGTGVHGSSGTGWGVTGASDGTEFGASGGVSGISDKTVGVFGLSAQGIAVEGRSDHDPATGAGVKGYSTNGDGVEGESENGTAVRATALTPAATALRVEGRVAFQTAGLGTVASRAKSATVNPGVPLTAATKVLVTLMSDPGLRALEYVSVNPTAGTFTVYLTGFATRTPISFAWFVIE